MGKVSVCMAVYNGSRYLQPQMHSILVQLGPQDEVVVVDDGSRDDSLTILRDFQDPRIRILKNSQNRGVVRTFERALQEATGEIIFLADQDDVWLPERVKRMTAALVRPGCLAVVCDATVINAEEQVLYPSFFQFRQSGPGVIRNLIKNTYLGCCMAITARAKPYYLPFPDYIPMHDEWLGLVCQVVGEVVFLPEPLTLYRRHNNNVTLLKSSPPLRVLAKRFTWLRMIIEAFQRKQARS